MRVHVGSGTVYLDGWLNIDLPEPNVFLAKDRPDLVERWKTTDTQYYAKHSDKTIDTFRQGPRNDEYVCDMYGSLVNLSVPAGEVSTLLSRQVWEHLSITEATHALDLLRKAIYPGGLLRIDVPDVEETLRLLKETKDPFYERHLLGPRRGPFGYHVMAYDRRGLCNLVTSHGFEFIREEENIHPYPSFCLAFARCGAKGLA